MKRKIAVLTVLCMVICLPPEALLLLIDKNSEVMK